MHIPDGFLSTPVWAALNVAAAPAAGYVARRAQREFEEKKVPLLGVMGAFVFAAQMINFPVGPGASGHLVGAALLAYTLGPAAAGGWVADVAAGPSPCFYRGRTSGGRGHEMQVADASAHCGLSAALPLAHR